MAANLPDGITRDHLLAAIRQFDDGVDHRFADSTGYDVVFEGRRYPRKAIVGLAARILTGDDLPEERRAVPGVPRGRPLAGLAGLSDRLQGWYRGY